MGCFGPIWTGVAPPPADSVEVNFRAVLLGHERPEMAAFFRVGLLFQGYLFSRCRVPRVVVKVRRTARTRMECRCSRVDRTRDEPASLLRRAESGPRDFAISVLKRCSVCGATFTKMPP